jgi:hypothetical protein
VETFTSIVNWAKSWTAAEGRRNEYAEYLKGVSDWRQAWCPDKISVLLIAESHLVQERGDLKVVVKMTTKIPEKLPASYVRLVYCLGYGENELCSPHPENNGGTWQFWDIFGAIAGHDIDHTQPRKRDSTLEERMEWKLETLRTLRKMKVWLVDASVIDARGFQGATYVEMIRDSFVKFVLPTLGNKPEQVWVIGRKVGHALRDRDFEKIPRISDNSIISQPQDHDNERYLQGLRKLVHEVSAVT